MTDFLRALWVVICLQRHIVVAETFYILVVLVASHWDWSFWVTDVLDMFCICCFCVCLGECEAQRMCKEEDSFWKLFLLFYSLASRGQTLVVMHGSRHPCLVLHPARP